ncbi:STAS domain-containing protein [Pelagicoccus sp. SDUM812003]|uniref:STAS domain-containing protein n=1 Tax=Pelagicoccus sp. SDUM812003 TaxID=3041267 RepID=UPI00280F83E7|nr:STAS domain-containing protein [Pelagicoccus sp. SDUM812003]MDQ8203871.1 STAS domain-containing protein [Pelagicoccus sp. SDUM812003]
MPIANQSKADDRYTAERALDIEASSSIAQEILEYIRSSDTPAIDLSKVESIDTFGVQILLAARSFARNRGKQLSFLAPTEAVRHAFHRVGFDSSEFETAPLSHHE